MAAGTTGYRLDRLRAGELLRLRRDIAAFRPDWKEIQNPYSDEEDRIIVLPARMIAVVYAQEMLDLYLTTPFGGDRHQARVSASLLHAVGLDDLVADSIDGYVDVAVALAEDHDRRRALRASMRERLANSTLCDAPGFADRFERAVREAWRSWCANPV